MKRFFSKHRRDRQNKPAYAACGILRRGIADQPFGIFRDKPDIHTDKFVFIRKKRARDIKTQPLCFLGILIGYGDYFTADFAANGIHHKVGNGRTFPKFQSREPVWPDVGREDIFFMRDRFYYAFHIQDRSRNLYIAE